MGNRFRNSLKNSPLAHIGSSEASTDDYNFREKLKWKAKTYILSPEFCSATSLPLYFFFGYQILQKVNLMEKCGDVSKLSNLFFLISIQISNMIQIKSNFF